jgi:hypothetical protein
MLALPLTAGLASAAGEPRSDPPNPPWHIGGGGFPSEASCVADAWDFLSEPRNRAYGWACLPDGDKWIMWVVTH